PQQLIVPETFERRSPVTQWPQSLNVGAVEHPAPVPSRMNQADVVEHFEMLRYRGLTQADCRDDIADRPFSRGEVKKNVASPGFGDSVEDIRGGGRSGHRRNYI